jgi:hypothetical protein
MTVYVPVDALGIFLSAADKSTYDDAVTAATNPDDREAAGATFLDRADGHWGTVKS